MRDKKCKDCKEIFTPFKNMQPRCVECAIKKGKSDARRQAEKARQSREKAARREHKARKEKIKTRSQHLRESQTAFNAYIRKRDEKEPCISCQRYHNGQYHAGHYRSVGACPELRFNEDNVHKQCAPCNNHLSANTINYRINLINKIGLERVEALENFHRDNKKMTIDDIKAIKVEYKKKIKNIE